MVAAIGPAGRAASVASSPSRVAEVARARRRLLGFGLADLARVALRYGTEHRDLDASADAVVQGMNLINGLDEPDIGPDASASTWGIYLMRLGAKQFPVQTGIKPRMARTLLLFNHL